MSNSFRIRTKPGVDTSIKVLIDQEFEYLEILSLKVLQSQIYTRQCSDYGVIVGRVSVNNGFGIPNAKVSVFIPLDSADESNPVISDLYPYKSLIDLNEDGYRYNLLPYTKSHGGHNPTGTFFTRQDVLTDPTLIEVFDKYYKYTTTTNSSGDYMIFGVPPGSQTVVLDVDLSDIGEFSLSPQDLVRMGIATPNQVAGVNFISSTNLRELPQIISINKVITVEPLWGQPEICNLGITRTDFDLSSEASVDIRPTSIFMGSIVSTNNDDVVKRNCKPRVKSGSQCSLVAGPGEILAIRQTIFKDVNGLPVLETVDLEEGGQVIDENGTWLLDVPMNLDYLITNEFGEQVISDDPKRGIPTKAKYRFKVKWNQSPSLSETIRRGYFLVPNIKEHGWEYTDVDPLSLNVNDPNYQEALKSYSFSLDWNDYADIQSGINCDDTFYLMQYNKVYTVSQLIDQYRNGSFPNQIISIKNILDEACESDNNKFPANDSVFRFDLIYFIFWIMLFLFRPILIVLIPVVHILWFVLKVLALICIIVLVPVLFIVSIVCKVFKAILSILSILPFKIGRKFRQWKNSINCIDFKDIKRIGNEILSFPDKLKNIKIPNLSYPDCSFCDCGDPDGLSKDEEGIEALTVEEGETEAVEGGGSTLLTQYQIVGNYFNRRSDIGFYTQDLVYQTVLAGNALGNVDDETLTPSTRVPEMITSTTDDKNPSAEPPTDDTIQYNYFTSSLSVVERLNLFNTKGKYFNDSPDNPGGGVNRIKVTFQPESNPGRFHFDNVIAIVCVPSASNIVSGGLISFQDPSLSYDKNITGDGVSLNEYGTYSITGTPINVNGTINVVYADPSLITTGITTVYNITQDPGDVNYAKFPMDVEYFQVITGMTYVQYTGMCNTNEVSIDNDWDSVNSFNNRFLSNTMTFYRIDEGPIVGETRTNFNTDDRNFSPIVRFNKQESQRVIFLVRGVDPNSSRVKVNYDLSRLFGYNFGNSETIVTGNFKLNHPIKGGLKCTTHNLNSNTLLDNLTGQKLYYDSFHFKPSTSGLFSFSGFTTKLHNFYSKLDKQNLTFTPGTYETDVNYIPPKLGSTTNPLLTGDYFRVTNTWTNSTTNDLPPVTDILVGGFLTTGLNPNLNVTESGTTATLQIYTKGGSGTSTTSRSSVYAKIYKYSDDGTEVLLNSGTILYVKVPYTSNYVLRTISVPIIGTTYVPTDRLLVKIFANVTAGFNIYFGFQSAGLSARLDIPNYTTPLTYYLYINNWDKTKITDLDGYYLMDDIFVTSKFALLRASGSGVQIGTQGNNGFIVEWEKGYSYRFRDNFKWVSLERRYGSYNSGSDNRGYFPGENVDGGSLFYQKLDITKAQTGIDPIRAINFYYAPRYSGLTMSVGLGASETQIIMRSDRLPTSTSLQDNINNSFALHSNTQFSIFTITDDGSSSSQSVSASGSGNLTNGSFDTAEEPKVFSSVIDSFSCGTNMAPLNCYYSDNNEIKVREKSNTCWKGGGGKQDFRNGCYVLMTSPINSLISDIERVVEWTGRIQTIFAACRNVFSHLFTNNWINGTLYAFTFKNDVIYTSPTATPPNSPINRYCKDVIVFNPNNNNFFYRSSPYNLNDGFIGHERRDPNGGNKYNLKTPTTMLDLGPRSDYLQEIIMSDDFDGYVVKDLNSTTFGDVSELLNMLIVTRLSNESFLRNLSGVGILSFFSRNKLMIDGDYSQMTSINSELGVSPFEGINYPDVSGSQDPIYYNGGSINGVTFGVFFSSDTVTRDFISPKRTIISPRLPLGNVCGFSDIGVFSQSVPFYQWIIEDTDDNNIFGTQYNGWATEPIDNNVFFTYKYQDLDRLDRASRYFRTNVQSQTQFFKSHIYSVSATTNNNYVLDASTNSWDTNEGAYPKYITVGAPYHFYFGLKTGKSAFDRFTKKWINTDTTI